MKLVKHKNNDDVVFQIVHRHFSKSDAPSQYWSGCWWTVGTTGMWKTVYDSFFVKTEDLENWEEYTPPSHLKIHHF